MSSQLDILALEPFYGGARRAMLETVIRCSRHRWTLLRLPPRRIERRLSTAAHWFAEQLSRHWVGHVDLLLTSEALNLANLYRLVPALARPASVVYFHDNQLPVAGRPSDKPHDLVNLNTATAATEIWFNSLYHLGTFISRASAIVERHPDLSSRNPIAQITAKSRLMPPPTDLRVVAQVRTAEKIEPGADTIFVETRDADVKLLNQALAILHERGRQFRLITIGPVEQLSPQWERVTVNESDDLEHLRAICRSRVFLSIKPTATFDIEGVRGIVAGCRPVMPDSGVYPELLPQDFHEQCLYKVTPEALAERLLWALDADKWDEGNSARDALRPCEALVACRAFDERIEQLAMLRGNDR